MVRALHSENIEYYFRKNSQIKVRGYRIDYKDIEYRLSQLENVNAVRVLVSDGMLVAFFVAEECVDINTIQLQAKSLLPPYMQPSRYFIVDQMPCNQNNKVDDNKLLLLMNASDETIQKCVDAIDEVTASIVQIWKELLGHDNFSISDNFFDCGGNSILLLSLHQALQSVFSIDIPLVCLFKYTTIEQMSNMVKEWHLFARV